MFTFGERIGPAFHLFLCDAARVDGLAMEMFSGDRWMDAVRPDVVELGRTTGAEVSAREWAPGNGSAPAVLEDAPATDASAAWELVRRRFPLIGEENMRDRLVLGGRLLRQVLNLLEATAVMYYTRPRGLQDLLRRFPEAGACRVGWELLPATAAGAGIMNHRIGEISGGFIGVRAGEVGGVLTFLSARRGEVVKRLSAWNIRPEWFGETVVPLWEEALNLASRKGWDLLEIRDGVRW